MDPFFFDADGASLFGCYHAPSSPARGCALVLANPFGHEYVQFHRVFRQLAIMLADAGFPVLRFDYTGTGDSSDDYPEWSLDRWTKDIEAAVKEVQQRAGSEKTAIVGLRLGGTLALDVAAKMGTVDSLVLWDPILRGGPHVEEIRAGHESMMGYAHVIAKPDSGCPPEVLGFAFPDTIADELKGIDLLESRGEIAKRVLVIESNEAEPQQALCDWIAATKADLTYEEISNPHLWVWLEDFAKMHVPRKLLQSIVDWFSEGYA